VLKLRHVALYLADVLLDVPDDQVIDDEAGALQAHSRVPARRFDVEIRITQPGQRRRLTPRPPVESPARRPAIAGRGVGDRGTAVRIGGLVHFSSGCSITRTVCAVQ
jgi:hypothetical protein